MVAGACGAPGVTALAPVVEECSTPFAPVTTLCPRMEASTVRAKGSSTAPATQRPARTTTVRETCGYHIRVSAFYLTHQCERCRSGWTYNKSDLSLSLSQACHSVRNSVWPTTTCQLKCRWVRARESSGCPSMPEFHPKTAVSWCAEPKGLDTSLSSNLR